MICTANDMAGGRLSCARSIRNARSSHRHANGTGQDGMAATAATTRLSVDSEVNPTLGTLAPAGAVAPEMGGRANDRRRGVEGAG